MAVNIPTGRNDEFPILFVDFNQDFSSLCVGTRTGYSLLSTLGDQVTETFSLAVDPMCMVGRLFTSSLVTLVSLNNMRRLLVFHYRRKTLICEYQYSHTILAVKMNRQRLVVCVEDDIFIHNIRDMEMLHKVEETPPNRNGVIALSGPEKCYLAYPGSHRVGTVFIFDALNFANVTSIAAHDGLLAALAFNSSSTMLATASERGTVVRVFAIPQGDKLMEFRRGLARCAQICCLSFSLDNHFLVAASNTETVHVFKMDSTSPRPDGSVGGDICGSLPRDYDADISAAGTSGDFSDVSPNSATGNVGGWSGTGLMGWVGGALKATAAYLPHQVSEVFAQDRAFAFARLPLTPLCGAAGCGTAPSGVSGSGGFPDTHYVAGSDSSAVGAGTCVPGFKKVAALTLVNHQHRLLVAGLDGFLHTYSVDPVNGGQALLMRTQNLLAPNLGALNIPSAIPSERRHVLPDQEQASDRLRVFPSLDGRGNSPKRQSGTGEHRSFAAVCAEEPVTGHELTATELSDSSSTHRPQLHDDSDFPPIGFLNNPSTGTDKIATRSGFGKRTP